MTTQRIRNRGISYVELLIAMAVGAVLIASLNGVLGVALEARGTAQAKNDLTRQAAFAMERIAQAVGGSHKLLLPLHDNPSTDWPENLREETVPASAPIGSSIKATAVLAVTLPAYVDLNGGGKPDVDDDGDGRIDEDPADDIQADGLAGIAFIDDDGDGHVDEGSSAFDDDEDGVADEDPIDGYDSDGDGNIDEDPAADLDANNCSGICGVDDDADGSIDETGNANDDEDGISGEDPLDPLVFYLDGGKLIERTPVPWNEDGLDNGYGPVAGRDFLINVIAENVSRFRIERLADTADGIAQVNVSLELTAPTGGASVREQSRFRIGSSR